ncbi:selenocysteine lyase-like isoform X2 [Convolutriloba macropyga]|uniref:selenocysteine lyase-like isoform X2 n=1 Tax=Convolutriloba macropyga TaxID=536237 RepID=UPI003F5215AD
MATDFVYLDNNATTPLAPEVCHAINAACVSAFANPSSSSILGKAAKRLIIQSRAEIAQMINADAFDIVFTSGGTEANNWVVYAAVRYYYSKFPEADGLKIPLPHIVTSVVEHDAMIEPINKLVEEGKVKASFVPIDPISNSIAVESVLNVLRKETVLVSIMLSNNETGTIFPVAQIMNAVKSNLKEHGIVLCHTDAAQSIGKMKVDVRELNVDYLTVVGHKFYGPRIGALYVNKPGEKTPLPPLFFGGNQERGFRSGTENTPMIVGLGAAARLVNENLTQYVSHMYHMKSLLINKLKEVFGSEKSSCLHFNNPNVADRNQCLINTVNVSFYDPEWNDFTASAILNNMTKLIASAGAACHSQLDSFSVTKPSRVLIDSGVPEHLALK